MSIGEQKIMIGWASTEFYVTPEGVDLVKQVIRDNQICPKCQNRIDKMRLLVGKRCIECVVMETGLKLTGLKETTTEGNRVYEFQNDEGLSFTSTENKSDKPEQDTALSIEKAGFKVPASYKPFKATEEVALSRSNWSIYGKLATQSVVVLHYRDYYGKLTVDFLAYRGGKTVEFNRRTGEHRAMLEKARQLANRTWKNRRFHIDGEEAEVLEDRHLLIIISQLESAMNDAQIAMFGPTEPETAEEQSEATSDAAETGQETAQEEPPLAVHETETASDVAVDEPKTGRKRGKLSLVKAAEIQPEEAVGEQTDLQLEKEDSTNE